MVDVYVYLVDTPEKLNEIVVPCVDGYTVYIDRDLPQKRRISALEHAVRHILHGDFEKADVGQIEEERHAETSELIRNSIQIKWCAPSPMDCPEDGWEDA